MAIRFLGELPCFLAPGIDGDNYIMDTRSKKSWWWQLLCPYVLGLFCFGMFAAGAAVPVQAQNVRISDYDVPVSRADRLEMSGSIRATGQDERTATQYSARGNWESFYNSLPFAWRTAVIASIDVQKQNGRPAYYRERIDFDAEIHKYLRDDGLLFGGVRTLTSWRFDYKHAVTRLDLSVGLGRYVEATALARALRIEEFLLEENILTDHLPKATVLDLASVIDRSREYGRRYGNTFWVQWYAEMDRIIVASGLVPGNTIGALGYLRIREAVEREHVNPRAHGWKVQAGTGKYFTQATRSGPAGVWQFLSAEFAWPLDLRSQLSASGRVSAPLYDDVDERYAIEGSIVFSHEISNRIDLLISEAFENRHDDYRGPSSIGYTRRTNVLDIGFLFYLEDKVSVGLNGKLQHVNERRRDIEEQEIVESCSAYRDWRISSSISYRIF